MLMKTTFDEFDSAVALAIVQTSQMHGIPLADYVNALLDLLTLLQTKKEVLSSRLKPSKVKHFLWAYFRLAHYAFFDLDEVATLGLLPNSTLRKFTTTGNFLNWFTLFRALERTLLTSCRRYERTSVIIARKRHSSNAPKRVSYRDRYEKLVQQKRNHIYSMYSSFLLEFANRHSHTHISRLQDEYMTGIVYLTVAKFTGSRLRSPHVMEGALCDLSRQSESTRTTNSTRVAAEIDRLKSFLSSARKCSWLERNCKFSDVCYEDTLMQYVELLRITSRMTPAPHHYKRGILSIMVLADNDDFIGHLYGLTNSIAFLEKT